MRDKLIGFGVSMEAALLKKFSRLIDNRRYTNRSEAISSTSAIGQYKSTRCPAGHCARA